MFNNYNFNQWKSESVMEDISQECGTYRSRDAEITQSVSNGENYGSKTVRWVTRAFIIIEPYHKEGSRPVVRGSYSPGAH